MREARESHSGQVCKDHGPENIGEHVMQTCQPAPGCDVRAGKQLGKWTRLLLGSIGCDTGDSEQEQDQEQGDDHRTAGGRVPEIALAAKS